MIRSSSPRGERASATASNLFSRNLGSTLGAAILGAIMAGGGTVLAHSLHLVFAALFAITCLSPLFLMFVPTVKVAAALPRPALNLEH